MRTGNTELLYGQTQDVVDLVKRVGARLSQAGFTVKFVLPNEETEDKSLATATAVLSDPVARQYVGASPLPHLNRQWCGNGEIQPFRGQQLQVPEYTPAARNAGQHTACNRRQRATPTRLWPLF